MLARLRGLSYCVFVGVCLAIGVLSLYVQLIFVAVMRCCGVFTAKMRSVGSTSATGPVGRVIKSPVMAIKLPTRAPSKLPSSLGKINCFVCD